MKDGVILKPIGNNWVWQWAKFECCQMALEKSNEHIPMNFYFILNIMLIILLHLCSCSLIPDHTPNQNGLLQGFQAEFDHFYPEYPTLGIVIFLMQSQWKLNFVFLFPCVWRGFIRKTTNSLSLFPGWIVSHHWLSTTFCPLWSKNISFLFGEHFRDWLKVVT